MGKFQDRGLSFLKEHVMIIIVISFFSIVKIKLLFMPHPTVWDEAVYIGMGKYIYSLGQIGLWEEIRPIGFPLILGFLWKLNLPVILFSELAEILFAVGNIILVYIITNRLFNKKVAIISSIILAVSPIFFYNASIIFTHIPSTFFALMSVYFFISIKTKVKRAILCGSFCAIAFMFRFPQGVLLPAYLSVFFFKTEKLINKIKNILFFCLGFIIITSPFLVFNYFKYYGHIFMPLVEASKHQSNLAHAVSNQVYNIFYYLIELIKENPLLIFLLVGTYFYVKNRDTKLNIFYAITAIFVLYYSTIINKQLRFSLEFLPYLAIICAYGVYNIQTWIRKIKRNNNWVKKLFIILLLALFFMPLKIDIEQYRWRQITESDTISKIHKYFLNNNITSPILTTDPTLAAFSDVKVYPFYGNLEIAPKSYKYFRPKSQYIMYATDFYPCYNNEECVERERLFERIKSENTLIFNREKVFIFSNPSYISAR